MRQRIPARAWSNRAAGHRPRVLIEDDHPALAVSDFAMFQQAGFDVGWCSGPGSDPASCPLLAGRDCPALAGADAVLHGLDLRTGVAAAIRRRRPDLPVVVAARQHADGRLDEVPEGCLPLVGTSSVPGQIEALHRVLAGRRRPASSSQGE